jgi:predicted DNA-binding protein
MKRHDFYLPKQQIEKLRKLSEETGLSMSELLRRAIDNFLNSYVSNLQSQDNSRQANNRGSK